MVSEGSMGHPLLDKDTFQLIIQSTPLVSIDLVIRNRSGEYLVGKRLNKPAKGYWFVPGGRIMKNETVSSAFARLVKDELNLDLTIDQACYLGLYDHFYEDSVFSDDVSTHYIVNAFVIEVDSENLDLPKDQHSNYRWVKFDEVNSDLTIHEHSRWYFSPDQGYFRNNLSF
jgi:colanic acid biosynthesis protein WcaH